MTSGRLYFTDNLYTRNTLAKTLLSCPDGDEKLLGIVSLNNKDGVQLPDFKKGRDKLKNSSSGTWFLVDFLYKPQTY